MKIWGKLHTTITAQKQLIKHLHRYQSPELTSKVNMTKFHGNFLAAEVMQTNTK